MTDKEKLILIEKLCLNLAPVEFEDVNMGYGVGHSLGCAIECVLQMPGEEEAR